MDISDAEGPRDRVLLDYEEAPENILKARVAMAVLLFAAIFWMLHFAVKRHDSVVGVIAAVAFVLMACMVAWMGMRGVVRLLCRTSGLEITTLMGQEYNVQWADVRMYKLVHSAIGFLKSRNRPTLLLCVPTEVRDKLVRVLQEASKARIVGLERVQ